MKKIPMYNIVLSFLCDISTAAESANYIAPPEELV